MPKRELIKAWTFKGRTLQPGRKVTVTNKLSEQMEADGYFEPTKKPQGIKQIVENIVPLGNEEE